MKTEGYFVLVCAIILLLASSGCNLPMPTAGLPTCPTAGLQAPVLTSPAMWSVVGSLSPSLSWSYPNAGCNPQGYAIDLRPGPLFNDHLGGGTGNPSTSWGPGSPLQPGREYEWAVQAINGTTLGPVAGYNYFFTGPMCATGVLAASTLLQPANGATITELDPSLIWQYPDACLPQGYRVDLSTDPTFSDTSLSGGTGNPSTRWERPTRWQTAQSTTGRSRRLTLPRWARPRACFPSPLRPRASAPSWCMWAPIRS